MSELRNGSDCACLWEYENGHKKVVAFCGAHTAAAQRLEISAQAGLYKIVPTSCRCGGQFAWVRFNRNGAQEMIGCVCHTKIFDEVK